MVWERGRVAGGRADYEIMIDHRDVIKCRQSIDHGTKSWLVH